MILWHESSATKPGGTTRDGRAHEPGAANIPAMPVAGGAPLVNVPQAGGGRRRGSCDYGADRSALSDAALLWLAPDGGMADDPRPSRQPQAGAAPDAAVGSGGDLPAPEYEQAGSGAQDLSVPAARARDRAGQSGVVLRRYLHPDGQGLLPGGDHGLGKPGGAGVASIEHTRRRFLRRGARGSALALWPTGDLQYRPGQPVHQRRLHRHPEAAWGHDQHGRQRPLHGQHLCRAAVVQPQIRGGRVLWKSGLGMRSTKLYRRWRKALRNRSAGSGPKPPQAARVKSPGGERCGKRRKEFRQVWLKETNASKPLMTCRNVFIDVETGIWTSVPRARVGGSLPTAQPASGMKAA